ncbi:hypothetical protein QBC38DRAFT_475766 [Podospora fimiseda]|uniref:Uncharacterized protein n=1 Tax=Podospora fimiseda TaxID=252190 RepID=A0AAN7BRF1_9PEZI|nr:hypothetical protein QBC38DRAFT_475766 [Podospora fimiseda]
MTPTRPNSFKPAFVSYLRAMDKYRFVSGYACDYCEERKRQWVKDGREEFVRGEMREGREVVREGENYWEVEEEDEEEGEEFGLKDLPLPEGAFIVRVKEGKKKGGRLRAVKSMDEMSVSVGSSWGIVENAEFEGGGCLHHHHRPVEEEEGETSSDAGVVMTPTTESDMEQWEFMERE